MASKTLLLLLICNLLISSYCEDFINSEEKAEDSEEIEETTVHSEEDELKTTTEALEEDIRNNVPEDDKDDRDTPRTITETVRRSFKEEEEVIVERDESVENVTDEFVVPGYNDVEYTNFTNNIDAKTETIPVQTTTRAMEEEPASREDTENPGPRIPKADNDADPFHNAISPPQSTRAIVRGWLEDSWIRSPVGILVPLRAAALSRALAVWTDINAGTLNLSKVCLMAYDENGVSWRSKHNLHPTTYGNNEKTVAEALSKLLLKYQGVNTDSRGDGTMRALVGAAKLVPYDSALFVLSDEGAGDPQRLPLALRAVVEKRLKVYTLWTNQNYPSIENNEGLLALQNISRHTEGEIVPYPLQVIEVDGTANLAGETELEQWDPLGLRQGRRGRLNSGVDAERYDLLVVRRGSDQALSLGVPVENGVTALRILIEGKVDHAVLYPPNEAPQIDLYNATSVAAFSPSSRTEGFSPRDVYLIFPGNYDEDARLSVLPASQPRESQSAFVGTWHLSVRCDTCDYRLCVSARGEIRFDVQNYNTNALKLRVTGPVASVRESQLVDEYGTELAKLPFSYQPMASDGQSLEIDPETELVADVALPAVKAAVIYTKIVGRDVRGEPFVRLNGPLSQPEVRMGRSAAIAFPDSSNDLDVEVLDPRVLNNQLQYNDSGPSSRVSQVVNQQGTLLTAIQIGLASRLYGSPGDNLQLHFEVTNYREQTVSFTFGAVGELRFLTGISPGSQNIASGQTVNVIVSLTIPSSVQAGARDTITFTAYGNEQISMSAYVYVSSPTDTVDIWAPEVRHHFQGSCIGRTGDTCAQHAWSATIVARDSLSGLLRLSSSPIGLIYSGDFVSGTRQEVVATYRATCCAPRMLLNAVDANGNANSYIIDISGYLSEAAIAAIVLGVFLVIALIVLLILLIYWCVKKRRESRELPNYNTRS